MTRNMRGSTRTCCCCKTWCPECNLPKCRPEQCQKWAPGTLNTEYLKEYPEKRGIRGERTIFDRYVESKAPFDGRTTNRVDFTPKRALNLGRQQRDSPIPANTFDGRTMYQTAYVPKNGPPGTPTKKPFEEYSAPFEGVTSNRADFQDWGARPPPDLSRKYQLATVPFDANSTYRSDFIKKNRIPNDPRDKQPLLQSLNLDNPSTYGTDFVPKPFARRNAKICCDERMHKATCTTHGATTTCCERPWTTCSSCVGH